MSDDFSTNRSEYGQTNFASVGDSPIDGGDIGRVLPRQLSTGSTRGTQTVGYGGAKIDGTNNRIVITNPADNTSIGMGIIPGTTNEFGFFSLDQNGAVVMKIVNGTRYIYDLTTDKNVIQDGKLPDGTYGFVSVLPGVNVSEVFQ